MNDEEERDIACALHHYFRDEHEEAREISEKYLTSKCPEIRLSALITNTMAMLQTGDAAKCRRNLEMIQRDGQRANGGCTAALPTRSSACSSTPRSST